MKQTQPPQKRNGWISIITAALVLIVGVLLVSRFVPVLYAVLFPPSPPRPENTTELSRDSTAYGVDTILYSTPDDACRLARYYQSQGATCRIAPTVCNTGFVQLDQPRPGSQIARCVSDVPFSIFTMRYRAEIVAGYEAQTPDFPTRLRLEREIFWSGKPGALPDLNATLTP
jgi:hypothetical protein